MQAKIKTYIDKVLSDYLQDNIPDWGLFPLISALVLCFVGMSAGIITVIAFYKTPLLLIIEIFLLLWVGRTVFGFAGTIAARLGYNYKKGYDL